MICGRNRRLEPRSRPWTARCRRSNAIALARTARGPFGLFMAIEHGGKGPGQLGNRVYFKMYKRQSQREATQSEVVQRLRRELRRPIEGVQTFVTEFSFYAVSSEGGENALAFSIRGPRSGRARGRRQPSHRETLARTRLCRSRPQPRSRAAAALCPGRSRAGARSRSRRGDRLRDGLLSRRRSRGGVLHHPGQTLRCADQGPARAGPDPRGHRRPPGEDPIGRYGSSRLGRQHLSRRRPHQHQPHRPRTQPAAHRQPRGRAAQPSPGNRRRPSSPRNSPRATTPRSPERPRSLPSP